MFLYCKESQEKEFLNSNIGKSFVLRFSDNPSRMLGIKVHENKDRYWRSDLYLVIEAAKRLHRHLRHGDDFESSSKDLQEKLILMALVVQNIIDYD